MSKVCEREWFGHAETVYFFKAIDCACALVTIADNACTTHVSAVDLWR